MKEGRIWSELSRGSDILKHLSHGIVTAGGDPDVDLMRIVSQNGLSDALGRLIMSELFFTAYSTALTIRWNRDLNRRSGWVYRHECSDSAARGVIDHFNIFGKLNAKGKHIGYRVLQLQRDMYVDDVFRRLSLSAIGNSPSLPNPMELVEVLEEIGDEMVIGPVYMPWATHDGFAICASSNGAGSFFLKVYSAKGLYTAGALFLVRA